MSMIALTAAAMMSSAAGCGDLYLGQPLVRNGTLATMRLHYPNAADCVHREGFNGRIWNSQPFNGPGCDHPPFVWPGNGPAAYGAYGCDDAVVYGIVNHTLVSFSPWIKFHGETMKGYEQVRRQWLRERGFTGGVRTFVNDAPMPSGDAQSSLPEPRAIIELAPDAPRAKSRMRVEAAPKMPAMNGSRVATITNDRAKAKRATALTAASKLASKAGRAATNKLAAR